ncbi:MAG: molybdenum cofactor biosynthesis protein MoaE [Candidatus Bathyarchaeota archaeon B63]|nr:MAG: molybdenum cofactor biosynthesis protein MoaE [Candidatus Bathyarchaeota archaeon B63]
MRVKVSHDLDSLESLIARLKGETEDAGAIVAFIGAVRGTRGDEKVLRLEYEAHVDLAVEFMEKIIEEAKEKHGIIDAVIQHRLGEAGVGEDVMYVIVASEHRAEAFKAASEIIERVKHEVPIWKKEVTEEGSYWVENA